MIRNMPTPSKKRVAGSRRSTGMRRRTSLRGCQYSAPLGHTVELEKMRAAEREQTREDKFWGLDLQAANCARECMLMSFEDFFSKSYEQYCYTLEKQKRWKEEFSQQQYQNAYNQALVEQENRKKYMKQLFASRASDEIIHYRWNKFDTSSVIGSDITAPLFEGSSNLLSLPPTDLGARSISLHLDGIQQSKALNKGDPHSFHGPPLRNRNIQSVVEDSLVAASISGTNRPNPVRKSNAMRNKTGILRSSAPEIAFLSTEDLLKAMDHESTSALAALEGHPQFKWDQEIMLKFVFRKLDSRRRGYLGIEDVAQIAQNIALQDLLRFTVFGAWVKRKLWKKFAHLCDVGDAAQQLKTLSPIKSGATSPVMDGSPSPTVPQPAKTVTLAQWMAAANKLSCEFSVSRQNIRTDAEHRRIVLAEAEVFKRKAGDNKEFAARVSSWYAIRSRDELGRLEREATLARDLQEGDCVWVLHGRGVVWFPAIIERVTLVDPPPGPVRASMTTNNTRKTAAGSKRKTSTDRVKYDVSYFMSFDALQSARSLESNRKLLELPSSKNSNPHQSRDMASLVLGDDNSSLDSQVALGSSYFSLTAGNVSAKRPIVTERMLCEAFFDEVCKRNDIQDDAEVLRSLDRSSAVSSSYTGDVRADTNLLVKSLKQEPFGQAIIKNSAALSSLFQIFGPPTGNSGQGVNATSSLMAPPALILQALTKSFPNSVSKLEFVEFCLASLDIAVFKVVV